MNTQSNLPSIGMISYNEIIDAIKNNEISICLCPNPDDSDPKFEPIIQSDGTVHSLAFDRLEVAGYSLAAEAFWNDQNSQFETIPYEHFTIKPGEGTIIQSREYISLSNNYSALHFGLHHNQMYGIVVGVGQIQPGWGHADGDPRPLYITLWNLGRSNFRLKYGEPISRLVFFRLSSAALLGKKTDETTVVQHLKQGLEKQARRQLEESVKRENEQRIQQKHALEQEITERRALIRSGVLAEIFLLFLSISITLILLGNGTDARFVALVPSIAIPIMVTVVGAPLFNEIRKQKIAKNTLNNLSSAIVRAVETTS